MTIAHRSAQSIELLIVNQRMEPVGTTEPMDVAAILPDHDPNYPLLGLVDDYGNTYFNRFQATAICDEWNRLKAFANTDQIVMIDNALAIVNTMLSGGPHTFLKFCGD